MGTHCTRQWAIKVYVLYRPSVLTTFAEEVGEVLACILTFNLGLANFLLASSEVFDVLGETGLEIVGRDTENSPDFSRDPSSVRMYVVFLFKSSGDLA